MQRDLPVCFPSPMSSNDFSDYFESSSWEQSADDIQWDNGDFEEFVHAPVSSTYWQDAMANPGPLGADNESSELEPALAEEPAPIENTLTVSPLDTVAQPIHPTPSPLGLPTIVVDQSLDPFIIDHLRLLAAPQVILYFMELGNVAWNFSFTKSFSRTPTKSVCDELIITACDRRTRANPSWQLEEGAYCCIHSIFFPITDYNIS